MFHGKSFVFIIFLLVVWMLKENKRMECNPTRKEKMKQILKIKKKSKS
jgi:hypothetical protein